LATRPGSDVEVLWRRFLLDRVANLIDLDAECGGHLPASAIGNRSVANPGSIPVMKTDE